MVNQITVSTNEIYQSVFLKEVVSKGSLKEAKSQQILNG